jgi:hypothetical protein
LIRHCFFIPEEETPDTRLEKNVGAADKCYTDARRCKLNSSFYSELSGKHFSGGSERPLISNNSTVGESG